jgi:calreticulin
MKNFLTVATLLASTASAKVFFQDNFDDSNWQARWNVPSKNTAELGSWEVSSGKFFADEQKNQGLRTVDSMRFYALTAPFAESFSNAGNDLIVQFSAKNEQNLNCGGAYVKVSSTNKICFCKID